MSDDDYGFEYSDDDQEEEDVNIENRYYNAKGDLADDVDAALSGFQEVVSMEEEKGEWGFKVRARPTTRGASRALCAAFSPRARVCLVLVQAHKQMVKLEFKRGRYDEMLKVYKVMLTYIKCATRSSARVHACRPRPKARARAAPLTSSLPRAPKFDPL